MFRFLKKISDMLAFWGVIAALGAVDVSMEYFCGDSIMRHGICEVVAVAILNGSKWACLLTAIFCVMGVRFRFVAFALFVFVCLIVGVESISRLKFNMGIGGEWYALLMTSSLVEMEEFVVSFLTLDGVLLVGIECGLLVALVIFFVKFCFVGHVGIRSRLLISLAFVGSFAVLPSVGLDCAYISFIPSTVRCVQTYESLKKCINAKCPERYSYAGPEENPLVVFVIGESSCRNYWSLYGYQRDTTPNVCAVSGDVISFFDVQAPCAVTATALRCLITDATIQSLDINQTLPSILKGCGYDMTMISNQGHWHGVDSYESMLFSCCHKIYIADLDLPRPVYDDAIVSVFEKSLLCATNRNAYFIHLMGSHSPFDARCPRRCERFPLHSDPPNSKGLSKDIKKTINMYDNTIAFTDDVLGAIIGLLKMSGRPSMLVYVSDHGETPRAGSWRHAADPDCWQVPMFVWFSDQYMKCFPGMVESARRSANKELQSDWLFYGLLELCGIRGVDGRLSFLSNDFKSPAVRRYKGAR